MSGAHIVKKKVYSAFDALSRRDAISIRKGGIIVHSYPGNVPVSGKRIERSPSGHDFKSS